MCNKIFQKLPLKKTHFPFMAFKPWMSWLLSLFCHHLPKGKLHRPSARALLRSCLHSPRAFLLATRLLEWPSLGAHFTALDITCGASLYSPHLPSSLTIFLGLSASWHLLESDINSLPRLSFVFMFSLSHPDVKRMQISGEQESYFSC